MRHLTTSKIEQAPRPWVLSQKLFIARESQSSRGEMVMSLKQITITINLLHVICWSGAHSLGRASIALR